MNSTNFCSNKLIRFGFIVAALVIAGTSSLSHAANKLASTAQEYQVGSMHVAQYGKQTGKGAPIILIPGLSSGAYVWDDTVKQLENDHILYVVTLAGFNGTPAIEGNMMEKAKQSLSELISNKKISKPILVGHSLGATLSIWFATEHSDLLSGVFAVDGLPVFPGTENVPQEQRHAMAQGMKARMSGLNKEQFEQNQQQYMKYAIMDEKQAAEIAKLSAKSDANAVAQYMAEDAELDVRKGLSAIQVPLALVFPFNAPDMAQYNRTEDQITSYYSALMQGTPKLQLHTVRDARHFLMLDQPKVFAEKLQSFVQSVE
ncbi:MAG: alpha/beta hydrolase [Undibacterium sp.]|nr:alpha/beta hydrolase [Undibacterium sp.]